MANPLATYRDGHRYYKVLKLAMFLEDDPKERRTADDIKRWLEGTGIDKCATTIDDIFRVEVQILRRDDATPFHKRGVSVQKYIEVLNRRNGGEIYRTIGESLGLSTERVRQIYQKAVAMRRKGII